MEDEIFVERLTEELARLKEPKNAIAERIGYTAQTFTNITKGRNRPSVNLVYLLKQEYPSFDINFLFTGIPTHYKNYRTVTPCKTPTPKP